MSEGEAFLEPGPASERQALNLGSLLTTRGLSGDAALRVLDIA